ncbi:MAG: CHAD domain-containing protein [Gammaproteobacteria bacterium]
MHRLKLCKALEKRIEFYLVEINQLNKDYSPGDIHDFRVASRYLLAIEPLMRSVSDTKKWRHQVKQWLKLFARLRDLHVFSELIGDDQELNALLDHDIENEVEMLVESSVVIGEGGVAKQIHKSYRIFCNSCDKKSTINKRVFELWSKYYEEVKQALDAIDYDQPEKIHKLRICFKPFRYFASFLHEANLVKFDCFNDFRYWQDLMGDINDIQVVSAWLEKIDLHKRLLDHFNKEGDVLRTRLRAEEADFRKFTKQINESVVSNLGMSGASPVPG